MSISSEALAVGIVIFIVFYYIHDYARYRRKHRG